ncbi:sensor domain-containing diguanylate cyclase [Mycolicibacterium aichiense]|uniref:GGDEF domain-containing protein n=1 Tax=Mycolicibacterium aichiense TaxID=1799 RepID=A0AAD1M9M4_9MYCO|nr:GGDEF domain-containing protein [Mycolicibacterium aichiense]MCV7020881.1 GGDEF domain-containing protein [Mycolicibacterium aichiense]BBX05448.1 hypothetical protein MAIC_02510 [Mycolicibacterium aichiense]STZ25200.1 diguanylate cyclase [Mycolicibacterium aichiense]
MPTYSRSFAVFLPHLRAWWSTPVDYASQVQYFTQRAISAPIQFLIGLGTGFNGVLSFVILLPSANNRVSQVAVALFAVLQLAWGWIWCRRPWPSRRMSLAFVVTADIGIAAVAISDASWLLGLFGFNAFAMISVYLMFFDGPKILVAHLLWIILSTAGFAIHVSIAGDFDVLAFTAKTLVSVGPVVATPLGIQLGIWALRNEANDSVTDPLTGLLNRRGLHLHIGDILREQAPTETEVAVMVIDLDRFKEINDTYGHAIGDEVLVRSARRVRSAVSQGALVARTGGEEFVVVDLTVPGVIQRSAEQVRHAISAPATRTVTASIGVTSLSTGVFVDGVDPVPLLETIIERADQAMFEAKRTGGDAVSYLPPVGGHR